LPHVGGSSYCNRPGREHGRRRAPSTALLARTRRKLLGWFRRNGRGFSWREAKDDGYVHIVTEVLLQRTRAEVVAAFLPSFFERFPSWVSIAHARRDVLERRLVPLGLWRRRALSLSGLARQLSEHNWRWPSTRLELERMPAVGQYVASAVLLFVYRRPEPLLDTNMARVLERVFGQRVRADIRYDGWLQGLSRRLVNSRVPRSVNWAVLDLAALVCRPREPLCGCCPIADDCKAYRDQRG
jgi:A/G-specific adenine glycosylase